MTIPELSKDHEYEEKGEDFCDIGESDPEYGSDDSTKDPSYSDLEETHAKFTELSIKKKSKARIVKDIDLGSEEDLDGEEMVVLVPQLNEKDEKSFEMVQKIIEGRQIEKLKVEQCKLYLRKNGLRLTGNKDTLIQRIKEHLEILNGGGEKRYPASSFVLNCKGDACTGDVVMFEQNVYEMFDIASRSARGPPCSRRIVAGHIVKESYGAAKQQHTFTIEVLWSKGEKPLPPLHPLLIKGRNLYRLKTLRQRWEDEGERQKALMEKHSRGSLARSERETRIQEKEKRKILKTNRVSRKEEPKKNQSRFNSTSTLKSSVQPQQSGSEFNSEIPANRHQPFGTSVDSGNTKMGPPKLGSFTDSVKPATQTHQSKIAVNSQKPATIAPASKSCFMQDRYFNKASQNLDESRNSNNTERVYLKSNTYDSMPIDTIKLPLPLFNGIKGLSQKSYQRQPLTSVNHFLPMSTRGQKQICRYYAQGRCYYGDNCKFSHEIRGDYNERREDRWPRAAAEHRRD